MERNLYTFQIKLHGADEIDVKEKLSYILKEGLLTDENFEIVLTEDNV